MSFLRCAGYVVVRGGTLATLPSPEVQFYVEYAEVGSVR